MNCTHHAGQVSFANCVVCGRPFCQDCLAQLAEGYTCSECRSRKERPGKTPDSQNLCSPGTAFGLGLIPGVGALYNGEYLKAFVHVMIFGFLISLANSPNLGTFEPLFVWLTIGFYFYMPLVAYHTAKSRLLQSKGLLLANPARDPRKENLWTGVILTFLGILLFLDNFIEGFIEQALSMWPIVLIGIGSVKILGHFRKEKV